MARGVLCLGRLYADLVFTGAPRLPTPGTEVLARGLSIHAGGGAAITGAYLAAQGRATRLAAMLPGAPFDVPVAEELTALGLDLRFTRAGPPGCGPQITVAMVTEGDRAFLTHETGPAFRMPTPEALRDAGIGHLHVGELRTLADPPQILDLARAAGVSVSLDCGWSDTFDASIAELIARVDLFLPNSDEVALLAGLGLPERLAPLTVVKCGSEGARITGGTGRPAKTVQVIDTTGAGDAFNGGFLHAWLDGAPPEACLDAGIACGALAVASTGGMAGAAHLRARTDSLTAAQ